MNLCKPLACGAGGARGSADLRKKRRARSLLTWRARQNPSPGALALIPFAPCASRHHSHHAPTRTNSVAARPARQREQLGQPGRRRAQPRPQGASVEREEGGSGPRAGQGQHRHAHQWRSTIRRAAGYATQLLARWRTWEGRRTARYGQQPELPRVSAPPPPPSGRRYVSAHLLRAARPRPPALPPLSLQGFAPTFRPENPGERLQGRV